MDTPWSGVEEVVAPTPDEFTLAELLPAVAVRSGHAPAVPPTATAAPRLPVALPDDVRAYVVLVADGLGWHQLVETDAAPFLTSLAGATAPVRSVLPSTTASNLVSLGTGAPSGTHGVLGYTMVLDGAVFNPLVWRFGLRGGGSDARTEVVPEALVPGPTMFERLAADGMAVTVVVQPGFLDSGLTRAGMRGGQRVGAVGIDAPLATALAATTGPGPALVYAHHGEIDTAGHRAGPHSPDWRDAVARLDDRLDRFRRDLPDDVALLVTADHGMVAVPDEQVLGLDDGDPLLDEVALVAGEPRLRTLVLDDPASTDRVVARFEEALDGSATVLPTHVAVDRGWFGPDVPAGHAARLGDVLVACHRGSLAHRRVDPHGGRLPGLHGSLTAAERDVPLLVVAAG